MKKERIYIIDFLRFISALFVVMFHYTFRGAAPDSNLMNLDFPFLGSFFKYGYLGVDLFFIISGFVILLSLKSSDIRRFINSRLIRLYPAYWCCLILTTIVIFFWGAPRFNVELFQVISNLTMFNGFFRIKYIDGVYWSLFVELRFYIAIILYLFFYKKIKKIDLKYFIYGWFFILLISCFYERTLYYKLLNVIFLFDNGIYFISGMLFFYIYERGLKKEYIIFLIFSYFISIYKGFEHLDMIRIPYETHFSEYVIFIILTLFYSIFTLISLRKISKFNYSFFVSLGAMTYPLYLVHQFIGYIILNRFSGILNKKVLLTLLVLMMLFLSYFINKKIEIPLSNWLKLKLNKK